VTVAEGAVGPAAAPSWKRHARTTAHALARPVVRLLVRLGVGPDVLTLAGLGLSLIAGLTFFIGQFRAAAFWMLAAALFDLLDGEVARATGRASRFGAFLDSTLDRVAEAALLGGIAGYYLTHLLQLIDDPMLRAEEAVRGLQPITWALAVLVTLAALAGSFMVSYARARAEGIGVECKVGWFERTERLVLLMLGALFGVGPVMMGVLLLLMAMSWWTAAQRVLHVWRSTRAAGADR
jgi:CDP-diacylglycerol--glycerol-3-phosphate 3-phosphatidyltransferase